MTTMIDYVCHTCGARGCKFWREYQTFNPQLLCASCACAASDKKLDPNSIQDDGLRVNETVYLDKDSGLILVTFDGPVTHSHVNEDKIRVYERTSDQLERFVPAIPDEEGAGYWGYMSIPADSYADWQALPTLPAKYVRIRKDTV